MPVVPVGYNVMMGKTNPVPYEDQATMSEVQRRNALLQQMLNQSMQGASGVVPDSGVLKVPNYAGAIGKILESVIGVKGAQNAAEDQARIADRAQQTHRSEMERFADTAYGKEYGGYKMEGGPEMAGPPRGPSEYTGKSKGDLAKALANAATSIDPQTRTFGTELQKEDVKRMIAGRVEPHDVLQYGHNYDPNSMPPEWRAMAPGMQLPPTRGVQEGVYSEVTHDASGKPNVFTKATNTYGPVQPAGPGTPPLQFSEVTNEAKGFQGGAQLPENMANQQDIEARTKILVASRDKVAQAMGTLQTNAKARELIAQMDPRSFGPASDLVTTYNNLMTQLGMKQIPEGTKKEELASILANNVRSEIHVVAPVSNVDMTNFKKDLGSMINSKAGAEAIVNFIDQQVARTYAGHEALLAKFKNDKRFPADTSEFYRIDPATFGVDMPQLQDMRKEAPQGKDYYWTGTGAGPTPEQRAIIERQGGTNQLPGRPPGAPAPQRGPRPGPNASEDEWARYFLGR